MNIIETDETVTYSWDDITWEIQFEKGAIIGDIHCYKGITIKGSVDLPAVILTELLRKVVDQMEDNL